MVFRSIDIHNILVFQDHLRVQDNQPGGPRRQELQEPSSFHLDLGEGINVIIGENGVGKTSLLKLLYAAAKRPSHQGEATSKKRRSDLRSHSQL